MVEINTYNELIGVEFDFFTISSATMTLGFVGDDRKSYELSTMADVCWSETELFKPFSDHMIADPVGLSTLYKSVGEKVMNFVPMKRNRACRLDFETSSLFAWANKMELPDCLFTAQRFVKAEPEGWWLIDDQ